MSASSSPLDHELWVTKFPDIHATSKAGEFTTLRRLTQWLLTTVAAVKTALPMFKLAAFGNTPTKNGCFRHDKNIRLIYGLELDYDGEKMTPEEMAGALRRNRVAAVVVTSPRHTDAKPRERAVLPFFRALKPSERAAMVSRAAGMFPADLAPESWVLSQAFFAGTIESAPAHRAILVEGDFIDVRPDLDAAARPRPKAKPKAKTRQGNDKAPDPADFDPGIADEVELRDRIANGGQATHDALVSLAGVLARNGASADKIAAQLAAALQRRSLDARNADWQGHLDDVARLASWVTEKEQVRLPRKGDGEADPWEVAATTPAGAPDDDDADAAAPEPEEWPEPMAAVAFPGLIGEVIELLAPGTEADRHALLLQFLARFGNKLGREAYYLVGSAKHAANLFILLAGITGRARKDTAAWETEAMFAVNPNDPWLRHCNASGLSSGEGLIDRVRDARYEVNAKTGDLECVETGIADKRLMVRASEFAGVIAVLRREGNTLETILRDAWDGRDLATMTKTRPLHATAPHISIAAHCTIAELREGVDQIRLLNGFANRFLTAVVRRSQVLPFPGVADRPELQRIGAALDAAAAAARGIGAVGMAGPARDLWGSAYKALTTEQPNPLQAALTARAEAYVVRLALLYALAAQARTIELAHLQAALEVWRYCDNSGRLIFGHLSGDPVADKLLPFLRAAGRTGRRLLDLHNDLNRHCSAAQIRMALRLLARQGRARRQRISTGGRGPIPEWWFYVPRGMRP